MTEFKKYAVQFPDGTFSSGKTRYMGLRRPPAAPKGVSIDKARLWNQKNHVTNHVNHVKYPEGTKVVEVILEYRVNPIEETSELRNRAQEKKEERRKEEERRNILREMKELEERLNSLKKNKEKL